MSISEASVDMAKEDVEAAKAELPETEEKTGSDNQSPPKAQAGLDWDGPEDTDNAQNWSLRKKIFHTAVPAIHGFTVTFASSAFTPGVFSIASNFHISRTVALLGLSLYVLGLGFGPILAAPVSETMGRLVVYRVSIVIFGLFTLGVGLAQNVQTLMVLRFLAGFFGGPVLSVGAGTGADLWSTRVRAVSTSLFILAPFLGPAIGPVIGGFAAQNKGWRWTQWTILFFTAFSIIITIPMSETYKKTILKQRAKKRNLPPPPVQGPTGAAALKFLLTVTLLRPMHMLFTEPIVGFFSLYVSFNFAVLFAFFAAFPYVFEREYHFKLGEVGLTFLGIGIGCIIAVAMIIAIDLRVYRPLAAKKSVVPPEERLYAAMIGSLGIPVGLFWFGWTAKSDIHWISPVLSTIPFAWGNVSVFASAVLYLIDTYQALNGASALAANGFLRYLLGAAFPLFAVQMYSNLGIGWATSLLGFISVGMMPVPFVLYKWGPRIRAKSGYDTIKA